MKLGIAVIGSGNWGPHYVRIFRKQEGCRLSDVVDIDRSTHEKIAGMFPGVRMSTDYRDLLSRHDIHAAVVATPASTHHAIVKDLLMAGKHVLCEKPLADSSFKAWELVQLSAARGLQLMTGHISLFSPGIEQVKNALMEAPLGRIRHLKAVRTNMGSFRTDVNAAWDLASHDICIFNYLLSEKPVSVSAVGSCMLQNEVEDTATLTLQYPRHILGRIHVSWRGPARMRQLTITGESRTLHWNNEDVLGPYSLPNESLEESSPDGKPEKYIRQSAGNGIPTAHSSTAEPLAVQAKEFVDRCLNNSNGCTKGSPPEAAEVIDILSVVSQSLRENGETIDITYGHKKPVSRILRPIS